MTDDTGTPISDVDVLDRVERVGAVVVHRAPVERRDFPTWRRALRRAARARGLRLSVQQLDGMILVSYPDHVVTEHQIRRAVENLPVPPELEKVTRLRGLHVVGNGDNEPAQHRRRTQPPC